MMAAMAWRGVALRSPRVGASTGRRDCVGLEPF